MIQCKHYLNIDYTSFKRQVAGQKINTVPGIDEQVSRLISKDTAITLLQNVPAIRFGYWPFEF